MRNLFTLAVIGLIATGTANAVDIYGVNNLPVGGGTNELFVFDSSDPAGFTTIGEFGVADIGFGGLAFNGVGGPLYAYASYGDNTADFGLYEINTATGAATPVGNLGQPGLNDIAYNPADGLLYGIDGAANLYTIDTSTGDQTFVTQVPGIDNPLTIGFGVTSAGELILHDLAGDGVWKYDGNTTTELFNFFGDLGLDTNFSQGLVVDWSRDDTGYAAALGSVPEFFSHVYSFGTDAPGAPTFEGAFNADGEFPLVEGGDLAIMPIPEPASLLMLTLGLLIRRR